MSLPFQKENIYVNSESRFARLELNNALLQFITKYYDSNYSDLVIMCIGTDRSTGDSLGPLIGHKLFNSLKSYENIHVFGTLNEPVHAKNLNNNIERIKSSFSNPFIIAIDACLGSKDKIGFINIVNGPLSPGSGVNKTLPAVGDISILGIVNISGFMEYMVLQSTRLSLVMKIADIIASSFVVSLWKLSKDNLVFKVKDNKVL
ncbi:putative sporulation protein YyaC [Gottschalkia acidurici 9a]|uniref:Sporulation protein YyaC n=1 Tax=Gottschalkia acidurici (strain ATCC 7906 / DSM 604 / BCRC 14475 / CIP 104303 / KCTC 5404 / NCIMB 10678 / 9a) TaxID=1128398 RepID=K0B4M3_GOTA9|nr:spore protease YyaC [Gottschalkia acidurici]AFS79860.1 putative sporulation protein YyaC [Gottschalkia acidurici 9a]